MKKFLFAAAALTLALGVSAAPSLANDDHDFTIINSTGKPLTKVEVRATGKTQYETMADDDGTEKWEPGASAPCKLSAEAAKWCNFDVRVTEGDGTVTEITNFELCDAAANGVKKSLELKLEGGNLEGYAKDE